MGLYWFCTHIHKHILTGTFSGYNYYYFIIYNNKHKFSMRWVRLKWLLPQMPSTLPCVVFAFFFFFFHISFSFVFVYLFLPMPLWVLTPILCCPRIFCSLDFSPHSPRLFFPLHFFLPGLQMNWGWTEHQAVCIQFCSFPSAALCLMGSLAPS